MYLTAFQDKSPASGPALTASAFVPDLHHYKGSFGGRVYPLWADAAATLPNIAASVLARVAERLGTDIAAEDLFAYLVAVAAHPGYVERFRADLTQPGLRIPVTADPELFAEAAALGRRVVWLQTFGERMADAGAGRPPGPPRLPMGRRPQVPVGGAIPATPEGFPDLLGYDASGQRLLVGSGFIAPVPPAVWRYEVSGLQVLPQWFSYRKKDRSRPIIGDRRPPSPTAARRRRWG